MIGFILSVANSLLGNPISSAFAKKAITSYVTKKYPSLELTIGEAKYNFKDSEYYSEVKSNTSIDTHFEVFCRNGKVRYDSYDSVLGKYNTLSRLEDEYSKIVIPILSKVKGLENNNSIVQFEKWEANKDIKLDMPLDKAALVDMKVTIRVDLKDASLKNIAGIFEASHKKLIDNGCIFKSYSIFSDDDEELLIMIDNVTPSDIESGKLEEILEDAQNKELKRGVSKEDEIRDTGISVYITKRKDIKK